MEEIVVVEENIIKIEPEIKEEIRHGYESEDDPLLIKAENTSLKVENVSNADAAVRSKGKPLEDKYKRVHYSGDAATTSHIYCPYNRQCTFLSDQFTSRQSLNNYKVPLSDTSIAQSSEICESVLGDEHQSFNVEMHSSPSIGPSLVKEGHDEMIDREAEASCVEKRSIKKKRNAEDLQEALIAIEKDKLLFPQNKAKERDDDDLNFLKSMWTDLKCLSTIRKLSFKIYVLNALKEHLQAEEDCAGPSSSN